MAPGGMLGIDHQKLAIFQCFLLKNSYGSSLLYQYPILWEKIIYKGDDKGVKVGLRLKSIIKKYGFGWLLKHMFNWEVNSFAMRIADQFPLPIQRLGKRYQCRKRERKTMIDILQEM